ncbi:sulfatase-like hydrolase/transferase [Parasphingopyxis marina]|uniref:Sulfatase-like hydrolase/transferase n=1 Tax=Parasphingopyxis marina TaxID=2761622 RepID=A0A842HXU8_9SPHN|nr:sulfatase-like hydrolase/transferase [Parasphingopyxis marina]MBC2777149.1 sulfatase-like hydrolase/transferase [Parasphingopyxis marina]
MLDRLARSPFARLPLAGFVIPCIIFFSLWRSNANRLGYEDALPTGLALLAILLVLLIGLRFWAKSWVRASMMLGILGAYIFYAPSLTQMISSPWLEGAALAFAGLIALDLMRRIPPHDGQLERTNMMVNIAALPLILVFAGQAAMDQRTLESGRPDVSTPFPAFEAQADENSPDVWHFVMDRYGNRETLAQVYGYDNTPFLNALRERGFVVDDNAFANYQRTGHSLASTLNASYLEPLAENEQLMGGDWVPIYRAMRDNRAIEFFNEAGYTTVFAGTWWNPSRRNPGAAENINLRDMPELARLLVEQSVPGRVLDLTDLPYGNARHDQCLREEHKFEALQELASRDERKYIFAHFLLPHPPYVINADGSCRPLADAEAATRRDNYIGQLDYANRELLATIDAILAGPRPATIILQADEGPWPAPHFGDERFIGRDPVEVDWDNLDRAAIREKMGILFAVRHADGSTANIPASPINIYPAILRQSFGSAMENLPDRHLVFVSNGELYDYADVDALLD